MGEGSHRVNIFDWLDRCCTRTGHKDGKSVKKLHAVMTFLKRFRRKGLESSMEISSWILYLSYVLKEGHKLRKMMP